MTQRKGLADIKTIFDDSHYHALGTTLCNYMNKGRAELGSANRVTLMQLLLGVPAQYETPLRANYITAQKSWEEDLNEAQMTAC